MGVRVGVGVGMGHNFVCLSVYMLLLCVYVCVLACLHLTHVAQRRHLKNANLDLNTGPCRHWWRAVPRQSI